MRPKNVDAVYFALCKVKSVVWSNSYCMCTQFFLEPSWSLDDAVRWDVPRHPRLWDDNRQTCYNMCICTRAIIHCKC